MSFRLKNCCNFSIMISILFSYVFVGSITHLVPFINYKSLFTKSNTKSSGRHTFYTEWYNDRSNALQYSIFSSFPDSLIRCYFSVALLSIRHLRPMTWSLTALFCLCLSIQRCFLFTWICFSTSYMPLHFGCFDLIFWSNPCLFPILWLRFRNTLLNFSCSAALSSILFRS